MYGLAGPLLISTISCFPPISMDLKFSPLRALFLSCRNSGSNAWWEAISSQFTPMSPTEAMTQSRSAVAASSLAADAFACEAEAVERVDDADADALSATVVDEGVDEGI